MRSALLALAMMTATAPAMAEKTLLWGDTHLHTSNSFDAITIGNSTIDPAAAYRYAKGLPVVHPFHQARVQIDTPLDFLVVSDHAEFLGVVRHVYEDWVPTDELGPLDTVYAWLSTLVIKAGVGSSWGSALFGSRLPVAEDPREAGERLQEEGFKLGGIPPLPEVSRATWVDTTEAADEANVPGQFTALIGWEWSSNNGGANLHRIVITDADARQAQTYQPFSFLDSSFPEDLWAWLDATSESSGADFVAIPHNSNISKGYMFDTQTLRGEPLSPEWAAARMRWETVVEVTQIKGDSETHPGLSPDDRFAEFETFPFYIQRDRSPYVASRSDYVRPALGIGLELAAALGQNPYQFGMIGSSDAHSGLAGAEEDNFHGKFAADSIPANKEGIVKVDAQGRPKGWNMSASGLAAVWAEENTREAIVAALKRREVYATSGPRIGVRFFAGSGYNDAMLDSADLYAEAVANGVPMGGVLNGAGTVAPEFLILAEKAPDGANLDRVQVVKGWLDDGGSSREQVFDVSWSGDRRIGSNGQLAAVGNTVDTAAATYRNSIGAERLAVRWQDPTFKPGQPAFYYARVLQIPTPRHSLYDGVALQRDISAEFPSSIQERAYTSPIWYSPAD